jgi:hypothetical protein
LDGVLLTPVNIYERAGSSVFWRIVANHADAEEGDSRIARGVVFFVTGHAHGHPVGLVKRR